MDNNSNTQTQLNALRTLQQSYDALATTSSNGATSVEVENAKQAILDAIGAGVSVVAQESTSQEILSKMQSIIDSGVLTNVSLDGWVTPQGADITTIGQLVMNLDKVTSITDNSVKIFRNISRLPFTNLETATFNVLEEVAPGYYFYKFNKLVEFSAPELLYCRCEEWLEGCELLEKVYLPKCISALNGYYGCKNLIDITLGPLQQSTSLVTWSPTNALSSSSSSLVKQGEPFANNLEKLLYNIRNHIAANLPDRTGLSSLTITFSAEIKAAIQADQATADAFANKNWVIA